MRKKQNSWETVCHKFPWKIISSDINSVKKWHTDETRRWTIFFFLKHHFGDYKEGNASNCESKFECVMLKIYCTNESAKLFADIQDDKSQINKFLPEKYVQYSNCSLGN